MYAKGILDMEETKNPKGYIKQLENVVHQYPDDTDAKLFLALFNMAGYDEEMNPKEGMIYSEYLLKDLLKTNPENHGVDFSGLFLCSFVDLLFLLLILQSLR